MVNSVKSALAVSFENSLVLYQPQLPVRFATKGSALFTRPPEVIPAEPLINENIFYDQKGHLGRPHHKGILVDSLW